MEKPTVAVLGGGQLGRMLALAGLPLGVRFRFLDPNPDAPAGDVGDLVTGDLGDRAALDEVVDGAAVVTYEWEGVPAEGARHVAIRGAPVLPPPAALDVSQDRLAEKMLFQRLGIPTARFAAVDTFDDLEGAAEAIGLPAVLKTRRGGYDGKGQWVLAAGAPLQEAWDALGRVPMLLEALVPFDRELSVLGVRTQEAVEFWPLVENEHHDGILRVSRAPAAGTRDLQGVAEGYAQRVFDELDYVGVLAIELFQAGPDLMANELAPRVHNSGHWTIEGAETSQFENHVRAILGWPLGPAAPRSYAAMVNCIGALPEPAAVLTVPGAHLHRYGKEARPGRKLGHVTVTATTLDELSRRLASVRAVIPA